MRKKVFFDKNVPDFLKLSKTESNPQKRIRLIALAHLKNGKTKSAIAESLGVNRHSVTKWYKRFVKYGLDGLNNLPKDCGHPKIAKSQQEAFVKKVEDLQNSKKGGRITGNDIQQMALKEFNADYADRSIYAVLDRLNISWITARSKHPKADEKKQAIFKKTSNKLLPNLSQQEQI